jgi:ABC-type Na+ transport system ATPase subunit NatA
VQKSAKKFRTFAEVEKADRDFYKRLTANERLQILVELLNHDPEQGLERVSRIVKFPRR